jgi:hypothetical protein
VNVDSVKCPVCDGLTHIDKPELLAALNDPKIRQQIENCVAEVLRLQSHELVSATQSRGREFKGKAHNWNPNIPGWRRSCKE